MRFGLLIILLLITFLTASGQHTIRGMVRDTAQAPLPGAYVVLKGTAHGVVTNAAGEFEILNVPDGSYTYMASFVGFATQAKSITVPNELTLNFDMVVAVKQLDEVTILHPTRANESTPTTYVNVSSNEIRKQNFGQDLPILLNWTPSVVTTSDAGAGIGYTGIRIRGSDASRVNVTINGIPYNDSESQSTFWVNIPDIASSTKSVQIQRGVGTSTNGPGAFGASINVETNRDDQHGHRPKHLDAMVGLGSFGTQRYTIQGGTGYMGNFYLEGRASRILSDGYIDRASSDLASYYVELGFDAQSTEIQLIAFGGKERTYQAWYGIDSATLQNDRTMNPAGALYDTAGVVTGYYPNQVDDYQQNHLQLHVSSRLGAWEARMAMHATWGRGYFEEYHQAEGFVNVGLPDFGGESTSDMVVRRWLDNRFYGLTFSVSRSEKKSALTLGGALSRYSPAKHFGEIIWASLEGSVVPGYRYYDGLSDKADGNVYLKWNYKLSDKLSSFVDLQYRGVFYKTAGIQDDQSAYDVSDNFHFFNPKAGLTYGLDGGSSLYLSYAIANREPNRSDYLEGPTKPRSERLYNLEAGWRKRSIDWALDLNYFLMQYNDQLVQTGELDASGYPIRANVGKSYRTGIEASALTSLTETLSLNINATLSANKNREVLDNGVPVTANTQIVLSPNIVAGSQLTWKPIKGFETSWLSKYVGKQYLDNSQSERVSIPSYWINDLRFSYEIAPKGFKAITWSLLVNNLLDAKYVSNGASYGGVPYYYPQAGRNFMAMMTVRL